MASSSSYNSPCAACKFLRRKCMPGCIFAPYFPPEEPQKFANVHKIFGASNVSKLLNDLLPQQRDDAVNSLAYEAEARVRDPVYGCVGAISFLQRQVDRLQKELDAANADLIRFAYNGINNHPSTAPHAAAPIMGPPRQRTVEFSRRIVSDGGGGGGGGGFYQTPNSYTFPYNNYHSPWNGGSYNPHGGGVDGNI
ncbi:Lateral organ boundaries domain family protein [Perilla frutescens var. frutescens]|nr:Lateral organ boundaries domain family protein [Perilla frutescens var. frutescens]